MRLIIASRNDPASISIAHHLLDSVDFSPYNGSSSILRHGNFAFSYISERHLYMDHLDGDLKQIAEPIEDIIFLSRHSSAADIKSITVHPTGNFQEAKLGGTIGRLSPTSPLNMASSLLEMSLNFSGSEFSVTYEATHHGPALDIPHYYLEIGTTEKQWNDRDALDIAIKGVMAKPQSISRTFVGIGGGHYMPKITRYSLENSIALGHMISKHSLDDITEELVMQSINRTPNCSGFLIDKKGAKSSAKEIVASVADKMSLETVKI